MANPASATYQIIGVYDGALCQVVAKAAKLLGARRVMTVHGEDGSDEISVSGPTRAVQIDESDKVQEIQLNPEDLGISRHRVEAITGGTPEENVEQARALMVGGGKSALRDAIAVNAGAALYVCELASDINDGTKIALDVLASGAVAHKVDEIVSLAGVLAEREVIEDRDRPK